MSEDALVTIRFTISNSSFRATSSLSVSLFRTRIILYSVWIVYTHTQGRTTARQIFACKLTTGHSGKAGSWSSKICLYKLIFLSFYFSNRHAIYSKITSLSWWSRSPNIMTVHWIQLEIKEISKMKILNSSCQLFCERPVIYKRLDATFVNKVIGNSTRTQRAHSNNSLNGLLAGVTLLVDGGITALCDQQMS